MSPYTIGFIIEGVLAAVLIIAILCVTVSGNGSAEKRPARSAAKAAAVKPRGKTGGEKTRAGNRASSKKITKAKERGKRN